MKFETFSYLWEQGIKKAAEDVFNSIFKSQQSIDGYDVKMDTSETMCRNIYYEYDRIRVHVREKYFNTGVEDENKIDAHKICACITGALLTVRIISINNTNQKEDIPSSIAYANYAIAFLASIYVMYLFTLSNFKKNGNLKYYKELEKQSTFVFPKTNLGHDSYIKGRIKTLALNDIYENDFNILMYADMLFWIEIYNIDYIRQIIEENEKQEK